MALGTRMIRCQFDMDLARAPCRAPLTARKKGSGYENGSFLKKREEPGNEVATHYLRSVIRDKCMPKPILA